MTDLVTRLRDWAGNPGSTSDRMLIEAADEIERLRSELQYARDGLTKGRTRMREDNERLRAALVLAMQAMRAPLDDWKGEVERKALDAARAALEKP